MTDKHATFYSLNGLIFGNTEGNTKLRPDVAGVCHMCEYTCNDSVSRNYQR